VIATGRCKGPWQDAFAEFGDLLAVFQDDGVLADHVDPADMAVEVDPDHRPVEARGHLLDMGGFPGAVIALHHDAAVMLEACEDRQRRLRVEPVGVVNLRDIFGAGLEAMHHHVRIEAEHLADIDFLGRLHAVQGGGVTHYGHCKYLRLREV
jgi:hypothetical protein